MYIEIPSSITFLWTKKYRIEPHLYHAYATAALHSYRICIFLPTWIEMQKRRPSVRVQIKYEPIIYVLYKMPYPMQTFLMTSANVW
jgi:hypothetical protein